MSGKFILPGLIDSHIHIDGSGGGNVSIMENMPQRLIRDLQAYLACGITAVISLTGLLILNENPLENIRALRNIYAVYFQGKKLNRSTIFSDSPGDWMPGR